MALGSEDVYRLSAGRFPDSWRGGGRLNNPLRPLPRGSIRQPHAPAPIMAIPRMGLAIRQFSRREVPIDKRASHLKVGPQGANRLRVHSSRAGQIQRLHQWPKISTENSYMTRRRRTIVPRDENGEPRNVRWISRGRRQSVSRPAMVGFLSCSVELFPRDSAYEIIIRKSRSMLSTGRHILLLPFARSLRPSALGFRTRECAPLPIENVWIGTGPIRIPSLSVFHVGPDAGKRG